MTRSRSLATALLLAGALAACDSANTLGPAADLADDDGLATLLAGAGTGTSDTASGGARSGGGGNSILEKLAAEIPGFAGVYRAARCAVVVVITDEGDAEQAVRVVRAVIEPLVVRGCPNGIRVRPARGQFTYVELQRFLDAAQGLLRIRGVLGTTIDYQANKLVIIVASRKVAHAVLEALPQLGIPADAVAFQPGRNHGRRHRTGTSGSRG